MPPIRPTPNRLLQALPAAEMEALVPMVRLSEGQAVEVASIGRDSVFGAGTAFGSGISLTSAVVVLPGTASVLDAADFQAAARRSVTFRAMVAPHEQALLALADNPPHAIPRTPSRHAWRAGCARDPCGSETLSMTQEIPDADRRTTQRDFDRRSCVSTRGNYPLQSRLHRYCERGRPERDGLRVLRRRQGASSAAIERAALTISAASVNNRGRSTSRAR